MKKTFILLIFSIVMITQYATAITQSTEASNEIPLKKDLQPQHRREPLKTFTASYDSKTLMIKSSDYTGNVQGIITGDYGLTYSYSVITTSGNLYSGIFEL